MHTIERPPNLALHSERKHLETIMTHHDEFLEGLICTIESMQTLAWMREGYILMADLTKSTARRLILKYLARLASARIDELKAGAALM